jgi:outer membrane protein assembly factor BamB
MSLRLLAYDAAAGTEALNVEVFRARRAELLNAKNSHASPTPIVDGDRVYVHFGQEGTAAVSTGGEVLWKSRHRWLTQHGGGGSPVLYEDLLIFSADGADAAYVVALDVRTGKERWKTWRRRPWSHAYSTPLVIHAAGRDQLVSTGAHYAASYDPRTGKEIWRVSYGDGFSNVPRPVFGHGLVFITTGFQQPAVMAIRPDGTGDVTRTHVAWSGTRGAPHTPSPLIAGDHVYLVTDLGIASCLDARTGAVVWQQRLPGSHSASPVLAGGRIYFQSEDGITTVIAPGPVFTPLASNALDAPMLASMAVVDGALVIRTATHLYRIAGGTLKAQ